MHGFLLSDPRVTAQLVLIINVNVKYLYCSTQHRERKIVFGYIVLPV